MARTDFTIPDPIHLALGHLVTSYSALEKLVGDLFLFLVNADKGTGMIVTESVSTSTVIDWCRTLIVGTNMPDPPAAELVRLLGEIDDLRTERNKYVHSQWVTDQSPDGTACIVSVRWERREIIKTEVVSEQDIRSLVHESVDLTREMIVMLRRLAKLLPDRRPPLQA